MNFGDGGDVVIGRSDGGGGSRGPRWRPSPSDEPTRGDPDWNPSRRVVPPVVLSFRSILHLASTLSLTDTSKVALVLILIRI